MLRFFVPERKKIQFVFSAVAKEGLQPVSASSLDFASIIEGGTFWMEKYEYFSFKQRLHVLVVGLKVLHMLSIFQLILKGWRWSSTSRGNC